MSDRDDWDLLLFLSGASACTLNTSPGKNWVEKAGGLPGYICQIARAVMRSGKTKGEAIAIAVSRTKMWAAGGSDVDAKTRAKAAAAVAQWEALKAKNKAGKVVKATNPNGGDYLILTSVGSFNTEIVRMAFDKQVRETRDALRQNAMAQSDFYGYDKYRDEPVPAFNDYYFWIRELWTDYLIIEGSGDLHKVPYTVDGMDVTFGDWVDVEQQYVEVQDDDSDDELTEEELALLGLD